MKCKDLKKISRAGVCYTLFAILLSAVTGCLTSIEPFYLKGDLIRDSHFNGTFVSRETGLEIIVADDGEPNGMYDVKLVEGGKASSYTAALFEIDDSVFVDLIPNDEGQIFERYQEGMETASSLLRHISHDGPIHASRRIHVVYKVVIDNDQIECYGPKKRGDAGNPILKNASIKHHFNGDGIVLDQDARSNRSLLKSFSGTNWINLFQQNHLSFVRQN